jgi:poly-gamma-glutamate capsule biosynthesis protein CapA/YwtB (metallophosphatase superfamily)
MMTDRERAEQVAALLRMADRLRVPGHRHTVDMVIEAQDEIRAGLRRLHRDLTGAELPREAAPRRSVVASFQPGSIAGTRATVAFRGRPRVVAARA